MAHRHYHTQGFILNERPLREKDILISVFTLDLGLVRATIKSARDIRSKLRPHASRYGYVSITLVRGREFWKVVGLETISIYQPIWSCQDLALPTARIFALLERLVNGEESAPRLFADVAEGINLMAILPLVERSQHAKNLECLVVLRVLHHLGYLPSLPLLQPFIAESRLDLALVQSMSPIRLEAIQTINRAFNDANV
ncbi:MAG: DNA repair protein RecO [Patescibacteria group bacterium]